MAYKWEATGDSRQAQKAIEDLDKKVAKLEESNAKLAQKAADGSRKTVQGTGEQTRGYGRLAKGIQGAAAQLIAMNTAADLVFQGLQKVAEQNRELAHGVQSREVGEQRLLQVSRGDQDFELLRSRVDQLSSGGRMTIEQAQQVVFAARSEGFESALDFLGDASGVVAPNALATVAGQIPSLFQGQLTPEEAINLTLQAAQQSRLDFESVARALPAASEAAGIAGSSSEESLAALSVLASRFKSGETAADRIKAFSTAVGLDENLAGQGLVGAVERLQSMSAKARKEFLGGGQELNTAFAVLSDELGTIKQRREELRQSRTSVGTDASPIRQALAIRDQDAAFAARDAVRRAESEFQTQGAAFGVEELEASARRRGLEAQAVGRAQRGGVAGVQGRFQQALGGVGGSVGGVFGEGGAELGATLGQRGAALSPFSILADLVSQQGDSLTAIQGIARDISTLVGSGDTESAATVSPASRPATVTMRAAEVLD